MKSIERCPLCGSRTDNSATLRYRSTDYISGDTFDILNCTDCGLAFTNPSPDRPEEFARYYPHADCRYQRQDCRSLPSW